MPYNLAWDCTRQDYAAPEPGRASSKPLRGLLAVCGMAALDTGRNLSPPLPISHRRKAKKH
jgi:hypothetical protein